MKRSYASTREPCVDLCPPAPVKRRGRSSYRARANYSTKRITYVTRTVQKESLLLNGQIWSSRSYTFKLSDLVSYSEFTNLFDQYKIEKVKLQFFPRFSENIIVGAVGTGVSHQTNSILWNCNSEDGSQRLFSESDALQAMSAKMRIANDPFTVWCKPKFQVEAATNLAIAAAKPTIGFLDTDNYGVVHYGNEIAGYSPAAQAGQQSEWKCYATYYLALKDVK